MASQNRRYNNKSGANRSEGSSNASSPASSINLPNTNQVNNNNAPKYGTLVPNRVFVGGISSTTTEEELCQLFKKYGSVKATKIIVDRAGVSKGYGFVTFESEDEANLLQQDAENIVLKERRLNIAPAIKKQPCNRTFEAPISPPPIAPPNIFYHNGVPYTFHNGMAFFTPTTAPGVQALPAPQADPNAVFQAYSPQPAAAPPTYGPAVMYSCPNPGPPMFLPQQYPPTYQQLPFDCFPQMPNGGPYIFNGAGTPSTGRSSPVNTSENVPSTHLPALTAPPPPPAYYPPYQQAEMCYPAIPQGMYPVYAMSTQDGFVQYCDAPSSVDPPSSNMSSEDASSTTSVPTSDQTTSGETQCQNIISTRDSTCEISDPSDKHLESIETPVVSLLSLQQNGEERERSVRPGRRFGSSSLGSRSTSQESFTLQASVGMMVYQPTGIYHTQTLQQSVMYNGHMMPRSHFYYPHRNQNMIRNGSNYTRVGRGGYRGRNRSIEQANNLPFVPKFPSHFNNNNPAFNNNNYYPPKRIQDSSPNRNLVSNNGRGGRNSSRGSYLNSQTVPSSPPPAPYSPMTRPYMFYGSNPSLTSSPPPPQVQQFIQNRPYFNASHQYNVPPPMPPKRYQNNSRKPNGSNSMVGNGGMNNRGKYRGNNNNSTSSTAEKPALIGAGDAPLLHLALTPPGTPSQTVNSNSPQNVSSASKELSAQIKTLSI